MGTVLAVDDRGQTLTGIDRVAEPTGVGPLPGPCPLALVVATCGGRTLLGRNRWRGDWELPGGLIEDGETARLAACRELGEETGIELADDDLKWFGAASFSLVDPVRTELAAIFAVTFASRPAVSATHELTEAAWCDLPAPPSSTSPLDLAIALAVSRAKPVQEEWVSRAVDHLSR